MRRLAGVLAAACLAAAQPRGVSERTVWFEDGTTIEFQTQSTGSTTPISTEGGMVHSVLNGIHRVVLDKDGKLLFVYGVEARRDALPQTFFIRIKPVDPDLELQRSAGMPWLFGKATHPYPTVAAVRDFPGVRLGDAIVLDILQNPATGEKIFDVISPVDSLATSGPPAPGEAFHLVNPRIVLNGQNMRVAGATSASGAGLAIRFATKGSFYVAVEPSPRYSFRPAGRVEQNRLTIDLDGERIELTGEGSLLKSAANRTIWVYHETGQDQQFLAIERRIRQAKLALEALRSTYTDNHPSVASTKAAIEVLEYERDRKLGSVTVEAGGSADALIGREKP